MSQVIECARLSGSPVILVENGNAMVVMDFAHYRQQVLSQVMMAGLTERELLDTINRTIAIWKQENGDIDTMAEYDTLNQSFATDMQEEGYIYSTPSRDIQE